MTRIATKERTFRIGRDGPFVDVYVAELKLQVFQQQELAAKLFRDGKRDQARMARNKLIVILNLLELHSSFHSASAAPSSTDRTTRLEGVALTR